MKITFQTKQQSNLLQQQEFLKLSKAERIYNFINLMEKTSRFPIKDKTDKTKSNFVIILKAISDA